MAVSSEVAKPEVAKSDNAKPVKPRKRGGITGVISLLIIGIGIYYFVHVQQRTAYFAARDLRILATVTAQIADRIQTPDLGGKPPAEPQTLVWDRDSGLFELGTKAETFGPPSPNEPQRITLDQLVRQVFDQSFVHVFDAVMIADEKGVVRWQEPRGICSATKLDDLTEVRGIGQKEQKIKTADLQLRAYNTSVKLEGRDYRLFSQPLPVRVRGGDSGSWVVVGVVANGRFAAESITISYTLLILVLAMFLLVLFSIPFLKLNLIGELQRVRLTDILLLGVSLLCIISIITIISLDVVAYRRTRIAADAQLRRLASDIRRHMKKEITLAANALTALDDAQAVLDKAPDGVIPPDVRRQPAIVAYPFIESFSRVNAAGDQVSKWSLGSPNKPANVADRGYFRTALADQGWSSSPAEPRYVVEAIRSRTTGQTRAVIAKRSTKSAVTPVVTLTFPMLSTIDTVIAGDCQFVVIDDKGQVVFHSESQRNNVENFFVETDQNRALRAAVAGRQDDMLGVRYWGEDQRAFVTPIGGTPWSLVTFRSKRLLRTLNVETIMIAVMFLLIHALGYLLFGVLVAIGRPSYRAPWLWPDPERGGDYNCLLLSYAALCLAFAGGIYAFRPRVVLVIAAMVPAVALFLTYLRLNPVPRSLGRIIASGMAAAAAIVLVICAATGRVETDVQVPVLLLRAFVILMTLTGIVAARWRLKRGSREALQRLMMPAYSYVIGVAGLLVISAVLPTTAMYKAAYKIETESFVKHGQLELVQDLETRLRTLDQSLSEAGSSPEVKQKWMKSNLGVYYRFFATTEVYDATRVRLRHAAAEGPTVPRLVESLLPQYSDHSVKMRKLVHSESADHQWQWLRRSDSLDMYTQSMYGLKLFTTSSVPLLLPRRVRVSNPLALPTLLDRDLPVPDYADVQWKDDAITRAGRYGFILLGFMVFSALVFYGAYFLSRKVFLVDVSDPLWLKPGARIGPALGGNILIFVPHVDTVQRIMDRRQFIEVTLESLEGEPAAASAAWNRELTRVDREPAGKGILIPDFDRGMGDTKAMELKLRLLESLINVHTRSVVAITTVSPWVLLDVVAKDQRWLSLLSTFTTRIEDHPAAGKKRDRRKHAEEAQDNLPVKSGYQLALETAPVRRLFNGTAEHAEALIARETEHGHDFLRRLGEELRGHIRGREEIYDEIGERAAMYYTSLWATCTNEEKAVLMHVAADGFANSRDRHTIRRLLARGLLRREPNFTVMNETFRRFVIADERRREVRLIQESDGAESMWDKIQKPLVLSLAVGAGFFFFTQRELFDVSFAVVSGVAGGIPAVLRLVGIFSAPREAIAGAK
jgi:hypothetical protein